MTFEQTRWIAEIGILAWATLVFYLWRSDNGDGKRKAIATFLTLGLFYPFMKFEAQRPLTKREMFGWMIVLLLMVLAISLNLAGVF